MIKIAIVGDIGSGKSHIAKLFNYPVFNADLEVAKIHIIQQLNNKLKKTLPKYFSLFPAKKKEVIKAIVDNGSNLKKITKIIHPEIRMKLNIFLKNHKKEKAIILDIPLLLENKLNQKIDIIIFIQSKKKEIIKRLKKRDNFNLDLLNKFKRIQLKLIIKKKNLTLLLKMILQKKK